MNAALITIGDEILIGQIVDTNSAWMGAALNSLGISIVEIRSVQDETTAIVSALDELIPKVDLVIMTGGLGPTRDDITKKVLTDYFGGELVFDENTYQDVAAIFERKGRTVSDINKSQAMVPNNCELITNTQGTAKGMWFNAKDTAIISMPGVPYEMKAIFEQELIPRFKDRFSLPTIIHRTLLTQGIPESILAERLEILETELPVHIKLAYLPSVGKVRLRLSAKGNDASVLQEEVAVLARQIYAIVGESVYGEGDALLEQIVGDLLLAKKQNLSTAESCSGGLISHKIITCPGSSSYFAGSIVAYGYEVKETQLNVSKSVLEKYGAVSKEVVIAMCDGLQKSLKTDWQIAVSGIAGPGGGTPEKPVGTIWIAVQGPKFLKTRKLQLGDNRLRNIENTAFTALNMLRLALLDC
jgi:nicotinamide-nucleotide amidase